MPARPLGIYIPPGRAIPDSPGSSRPTSPTATIEDPPAAVARQVLPTPPADAAHVPVKSRSWEMLAPQKVSSIDKPIAVVTPSDQSTLILPSPPRDDEKYMYAVTRRYVSLMSISGIFLQYKSQSGFVCFWNVFISQCFRWNVVFYDIQS